MRKQPLCVFSRSWFVQTVTLSDRTGWWFFATQGWMLLDQHKGKQIKLYRRSHQRLKIQPFFSSILFVCEDFWVFKVICTRIPTFHIPSHSFVSQPVCQGLEAELKKVFEFQIGTINSCASIPSNGRRGSCFILFKCLYTRTFAVLNNSSTLLLFQWTRPDMTCSPTPQWL